MLFLVHVYTKLGSTPPPLCMHVCTTLGFEGRERELETDQNACWRPVTGLPLPTVCLCLPLPTTVYHCLLACLFA